MLVKVFAFDFGPGNHVNADLFPKCQESRWGSNPPIHGAIMDMVTAGNHNQNGDQGRKDMQRLALQCLQTLLGLHQGRQAVASQRCKTTPLHLKQLGNPAASVEFHSVGSFYPDWTFNHFSAIGAVMIN